MKILITGVAGFIGTNTALNLLKKKHIIYGVDNFDNFNSLKLKKYRIKDLKKNKKFFFKKIDITNRKSLLNYIKNKKIDLIIHLAAQAGVRYSIMNPSKYTKVNILGFLNVIFAAKNFNIRKIIYASSSSVYGDSKKYPVNEQGKLEQKNIYATTKMLNEKMAETYSKISNIKFIGLRFFTIYGEYGRPDMFLFKLFKSSFNKKTFELNNYGNHERDFTYIKDVNKILEKLLNFNAYNHIVFNICSNNPVNILDIVKKFKDNYSVKIKYIKKHQADIIKTHGDNSKIKNSIRIKKISSFYDNFINVYNWYKDNKIYRL
tara:strand:- start:123 stop:1076 length:954 start_codon:yes stop_codon:yes gene_type:complete